MCMYRVCMCMVCICVGDVSVYVVCMCGVYVCVWYMVITGALGLYLSGVEVPLGKITMIKQFLTEGVDFYHGGFSEKVEAIQNIISPHLSYRECISVLFFGLLFTHPLLFIKDFSILFIILIPLAFWHFRKVKPTEAVQVIIAAGMILYLITLFYYFRMFYLANRHTLTIQLLVLLIVPFYFRDFFTKSLRLKQVVTVLAMTVIGAHSYLQLKVDPTNSWVLHSVYQYEYKVDAANWLKHHMKKNQTLYTNDVHMYVTAVGFRDQKRNKRVKHKFMVKNNRTYDFYAFSIKHKEWKQPLIEQLTAQYGQPLKTFVGWKDDRMVIFSAKG